MNRTWCLAMLPVVVASAAHAQSVAGDWQGTLKDGSTDLKTVLHIVSGGGALKATIDSPDQGAYAIPITSVSFKDLKLTWSSDALGATYEGTLSPQGDSIQGMFTQRGQTVALDFKRITGPPVQPSDIDGEWRGILEAGPTRLHIALHFINTADGLNATLDSLDQGAMAIPATVERKGDSLKLVFKALGATYEAKIKSDRSAISGTFTQGATPMALDLTRANPAAQAKRPQNPVKPYPYREEDVVYDNPSAPGVRLAATFTIPKGQGPFPAVLLITGSGPQDRDESLLGHKPFLVLSDFLTRHGIAVLRADDLEGGRVGARSSEVEGETGGLHPARTAQSGGGGPRVAMVPVYAAVQPRGRLAQVDLPGAGDQWVQRHAGGGETESSGHSRSAGGGGQQAFRSCGDARAESPAANREDRLSFRVRGHRRDHVAGRAGEDRELDSGAEMRSFIRRVWPAKGATIPNSIALSDGAEAGAARLKRKAERALRWA